MARINVNTCDPEALVKLPGIGPALAERIVAHRTSQGPFQSKKELLAVTGISENLLGKIVDRIALSSSSGTSVSQAAEPAGRASTTTAEKPEPTVKPAKATEKEETRVAGSDTVTGKKDSSLPKKRKKKKRKKKKSGLAVLKTDAKKAGVPQRTLQAVTKVIASERGFLRDGRPRVSFDGELFWRELKKRGLNVKAIRKQYPTVVHKKNPGKYPLKGTKEYRRVNRALRIHPQAALRSTYWGRYKVSGALYKKAGYEKMSDFVRAQHTSEKQQLTDFLAVIGSKRIRQALKKKAWKDFVELYFNGSRNGASPRDLTRAYRKLVPTKKK